MSVPPVNEPKGFASLKSESGKISWKDPATGTTREISFSIVSKETAAKAGSKANMVFMAGGKQVEPGKGDVAIKFSSDVQKNLTPRQLEACIEALTKERVDKFAEANPEAAAVIDKQFPAEAAEKIKGTVALAFPLLAKALRKNGNGNQAAKLTFYNEGTKYKIELQRNEDRSLRLICIGGKLASGGVATVLKMAGINIPKNLSQATEGWAGVYYKPLA
jgi:rhodanese-related sulfurtransferase